MKTRGNPKKFSYMSRIKYGWNTVRKITFFGMCGIYPLCPAEYPGCIHASLRSPTPGRMLTRSSLVLYSIPINYLQKNAIYFALIILLTIFPWGSLSFFPPVSGEIIPECWPSRMEAAAYPDRPRHRRYLWLTGHESSISWRSCLHPPPPTHLTLANSGVWQTFASGRERLQVVAANGRGFDPLPTWNKNGMKWTFVVICFCAARVLVGRCPGQLLPSHRRTESSPPCPLSFSLSHGWVG